MAALLAANADKMPRRHLADSDDLQAIKFTGGSSGVPKGVMQSYRVFNSCIASMIAAFGFDAKDRHLLAAPMTHGANTMILPIFALAARSYLWVNQALRRFWMRLKQCKRQQFLCRQRFAI
jgi:long-subunit acyl-CoA synthetase (AMP-forming)